MRRLLTSLTLACAALLSATAAHATVDWSWSFTKPVLNLADSPSVFVTLTNHSTSDENIGWAFVDANSFGFFLGLVMDPNGNVLTPAILGVQSPIAPGQSVTFEALRFSFVPGAPYGPGLPNPGVAISPTIVAEIGNTCSYWVSGSVCRQDPLPASSALTIIYSPAPEPASWGLLAAGLIAVGMSARISRARERR
ncbi:PEP-CTERM sorting domain-containing protein [Roseateles sp. P5_E4]